MNVRLPKDANTHINDPDDIYAIMQKVLLRQNKIHRQKEYFWTIGLNIKNDIQYVELVALGSINKVGIDPTEVFHLAVSKKCKQIILIHNHPSGGLEPSKSDLQLTKDMIQASKILKIDILDHLIISETDYRSIIDDAILDR
ncbi:MAG: JAB domain-containing protein [Bacteroidota bacterium]